MRFDDQREVGGHRVVEASQRKVRDKFIEALRRERYGGGKIPHAELEAALKAVGLWQCNGRAV